MRRCQLLSILCLLASPFRAEAFEVNGRHWLEMPIPYVVNPENCPVLEDGTTIEELLAGATAAWSSVPCAGVSFEFLGTSASAWEADGLNTIYCISDKAAWGFGDEAAGATMWIPTGDGEPNEVDLALNAAFFKWKKGGGNAMAPDTVDPQAVITHELGHWLGLSHSSLPYATMYFAMLPFGLQATLEADDKLGLCSLYPREGSECTGDEACGKGRTCTVVEGIGLCEDAHDGPGAFCSKDMINCEGMCWVSLFECSQVCVFSNYSYSAGTCAQLCGEDYPPCQEGYACAEGQGGNPDLCQPVEVGEDVSGAADIVGSDDQDSVEVADAGCDTWIPDGLDSVDQTFGGDAGEVSSGDVPREPDAGSSGSSGCHIGRGRAAFTFPEVFWLLLSAGTVVVWLRRRHRCRR